MVEIATNRLFIRPARKSDCEQLHEVFSNRDAMKYWSRLPHTHFSETEQFIDGMLSIPLSKGEDFVVEFDEVVIGKAGFWRFPEIGFIFHPKYWGMGLGSEALTAIINYGFQTRNLPKIIADVDPLNRASVRLLTRHGFSETGREENTFKLGDVWCDSVYFELKNPNSSQI